jgi:hypothetical protein
MQAGRTLLILRFTAAPRAPTDAAYKIYEKKISQDRKVRVGGDTTAAITTTDDFVLSGVILVISATGSVVVGIVKLDPVAWRCTYAESAAAERSRIRGGKPVKDELSSTNSASELRHCRFSPLRHDAILKSCDLDRHTHTYTPRPDFPRDRIPPQLTTTQRFTWHLVPYGVPWVVAGVDREHVLQPRDLGRWVSGGGTRQHRVVTDLDDFVGRGRLGDLREARGQLVDCNKENGQSCRLVPATDGLSSNEAAA